MPDERPLRIHWSAPSYPSPFIEWCDHSERYGIESVNIPVFDVSAALKLAATVGAAASRIQFRIGWSADAELPSEFGQQLRDAWDTLDGRIIVHVHLAGDMSALDR